MTKPSFGIRMAAGVYGGVLKISGRQALASRRGEVLQSFVDSCVDAQQNAGALGVCARSFGEFWDLLRAAVAPKRRATQIADHTQPPTQQSNGSRGWATDVRHAMRALVARRFDTALTVTLLALGIATTSTIFAVADALLINPVPFVESERLVQVWSTIGQNSTTSVPRDLAVRWLERKDLFSTGGAYVQTSALVTSGGDPEVISAVAVTPSMFDTLGVRPLLGRNFVDGEGQPGTDQIAIISTDVWSSRFGKAPDVIGRSMTINAKSYQVVGVMPADFRFPYSRQRIWLPFDLKNPPAAQKRAQVTLTARMAPGQTREQVTAQVKAAGPEIAKLAATPWRFGATTRFLDSVMMDTETRRSIWLLFGATVLLMLTVCANVANLGLSQAFGRVRDAAIRSALGASRWRMIRQTLVEQLSVGFLALAIALPLTMATLQVAESLLPLNYTLASLNTINLDARLLMVMAALALGAPLISGLVPAIAGSKPSVLDALKQESRSVTGSRAARWFRKSLVVIEVACSVVLLVSAALLVRSFMLLQSVDKGFESQNLVSVNLGFPTTYFADNVGRGLYLDEAVARLRRVPGVRSATYGTGIPPMNGGISFGDMETDAHTAQKNLVLSMYEVRPEFFDTMGITIKAGRPFLPNESAHHVIVSEQLAQQFWPGENAVGRRFRWDEKSPWQEVVGVVAQVRESASGSKPWPQIFEAVQPRVASTKQPTDSIAEWKRIGVRVDDPAAAIPRIRAALKEINAGILVESIDRVDDQLAKELDRPRFLLALMLVFACAGLVLAAVGVYGVLSCLVAEQLREYGIRLMLGASPNTISRTILFGGLGTTLVGLTIGIAAAAAMGKTINTVLFQVQPRDLTSYGVVIGVMVIATIAAAWRPARRARSVDPAVLLRNE